MAATTSTAAKAIWTRVPPLPLRVAPLRAVPLNMATYCKVTVMEPTAKLITSPTCKVLAWVSGE